MIRLQVTNYVQSRNKCLTFLKRCFCKSIQEGNTIQHLNTRGLIRVQGNEAVPFLQGLMTNDMKHLQDKPGSMYALFLNTKGRVVYDSIIYSTDDPNSYLLECDSSVLDKFQKHLKMFKVKRKIDIELQPSKIWALFDNRLIEKISYNDISSELPKENIKPPTNVVKHDKCEIFKDPRMNLLGSRLICDESLTNDDIISLLNIAGVKLSNDDDYRKFRYSLGVGEGVSDLPQGSCFPLEANADFLHGVSFHKGCYIGQELTARTHHTGVVRKRLMPLLFEKDIESGVIVQESPVFGFVNDKTSCGKVRGVSLNVGLGLLRIAEVSQEESLNVSGNKAKTYKPSWWPEEAPKEKVSAG